MTVSRCWYTSSNRLFSFRPSKLFSLFLNKKPIDSIHFHIIQCDKSEIEMQTCVCVSLSFNNVIDSIHFSSQFHFVCAQNNIFKYLLSIRSNMACSSCSIIHIHRLFSFTQFRFLFITKRTGNYNLTCSDVQCAGFFFQCCFVESYIFSGNVTRHIWNIVKFRFWLAGFVSFTIKMAVCLHMQQIKLRNSINISGFSMFQLQTKSNF